MNVSYSHTIYLLVRELEPLSKFTVCAHFA